jgi:hypothetical protein
MASKMFTEQLTGGMSAAMTNLDRYRVQAALNGQANSDEMMWVCEQVGDDEVAAVAHEIAAHELVVQVYGAALAMANEGATDKAIRAYLEPELATRS